MSNVTPLKRKRAINGRLLSLSQRVSRIHLVGAIRIIGQHGENLLPKSKKTQAVLAFLCLAEGQRVSRGRLAGLIWDRSAEMHARDSLRQALNDLDEVGGSWRVERTRHSVRLDTTACWIDALECPDRPDQLLDDLEGISPAFDHWLLGERARFENRWQTKLEEELDDLIAKDAPPEARATGARKLLNFLPTHDPAVRKLMSAYLEMDDRALAIREYERFRALVEHAHGIRPSEKTAALYDEIRRTSHGKAGSPTQARRHITGDAGQAEAEPTVHRLGPGAPLGCAREPAVAVLPFRCLSRAVG